MTSNVTQLDSRRFDVNGVPYDEDLLALDGKDLVCWCAPYRCHGDTIMKAIEWAKKQS